MEETAAERKARLKALRAAAEDAGALPAPSDDECVLCSPRCLLAAPALTTHTPVPAPRPPLKFRNYVPRDDELRAAKVEEPKAPEPELPLLGAPPGAPSAAPEEDGNDDSILTLQPKKANWDLQRDVERKLAKLERRTQKAMLDLMRQEEQKRLADTAAGD